MDRWPVIERWQRIKNKNHYSPVSHANGCNMTFTAILPAARVSPLLSAILAVLYELSSYVYAIHMREQYILQPTESSPGTGNPGHQRQRMAKSCWQYVLQLVISSPLIHAWDDLSQAPTGIRTRVPIMRGIRLTN